MNRSIEEDFGGINLGDKRLNRRLLKIAGQLYQKPDLSPTAACGGWAETTAAFRFFNNERVTSEKIFESHHQGVLRRIKEYGGDTLLSIQDTTELQYSTHKSLQGVGNLGDRGRKGFWAHSQYVVSSDAIPLGVWHSKFTIPAVEDPTAEKEKISSAQRRKTPIEEKKTFCWLEGYRLSCQLAELNPERTIVSVMDREGDIYEIFAERELLKKQGKPSAHWLVRLQHDRLLDETSGHLLERMDSAPVLGSVTFEVKARPADKKERKAARSARTVVQEVRACTLDLKAPRDKEHLGPIRVTVISVRELHTPEGEEPIHWILVTSLEALTLQQASDLIGYYLVRWEIEVFHKILKSGCTVEKLQFEQPERLVPCICVYMIIAWRIHFLTKLGRHCPQLPCSTVFEEAEWKAVVRILKGPEAVHTEPSLGEFNQMVGRLGGHLNRKGDGAPGPQTMWRGMDRVRQWALCWTAFGAG
jgi:hypothetical protein